MIYLFVQAANEIPIALEHRSFSCFLYETNQLLRIFDAVGADNADAPDAVRQSRLDFIDAERDTIRCVSLDDGGAAASRDRRLRALTLAPVVAESPVTGDVAVICAATGNTVVALQASIEDQSRDLRTWRYIRGGGRKRAQRTEQQRNNSEAASAQAESEGSGQGSGSGQGDGSGQGGGEGVGFDAQGEGPGDGSGNGSGDGSGSGAPTSELAASVSAEAHRAAQAAARRALLDTLASIELAEFDSRAYERRLARVGPAIARLRSVFEAAQAVSRERRWQRRTESGELDEQRLVDGLTGERDVYRRRVEREPGIEQPLPKCLVFVVDCS